MKNRLLTFAGFLAIIFLLAKIYEKPLLAQIRAALVQNVDEPGRNPFVVSSEFGPTTAQWTVPSGKRYVIEQYTLLCNQLSRIPVTNVVLRATSGGGVHSSYAPANVGQVISPLFTEYTVTGKGPVYADAGTTFAVFPALYSDQTPPNQTFCSFSVSGYSVSNP